ncbi:MAG: indole-3-glycerol phosphate synthase TrpC [Armatimonadetes bacterium]|nr:MAG: indole-3-glycerol phosphate synthase TrpC [Armatimonadota bacterium]
MLSKILASADRRAIATDAAIDQYRELARGASPARDFTKALTSEGLSIIAEIKRRSPSVGDISTDLDPVRQAVAYEAGGASAISVLTEPDFFGGSLDDLRAVRDAVSVPVLRKDFTRSTSQIWEARAAGADAVLVIVAALSDAAIGAMLDTAQEAGLTAVVEAHTIEELHRAIEVGASVVGVNNRDLHTFETDLAVAEEAADHLHGDVVSIAESGVSTTSSAARMARAGYDAILVGEALVRAPDPAAMVEALRSVR